VKGDGALINRAEKSDLAQKIYRALETIANPTLGSNDISSTVKEATSTLTKCFKSVQSLPILFQILFSSDSPQIRQLAAVELRKQIKKQKGRLWTKIDVSSRNDIKTKVLEFLGNEHR
jgi:hypothetical protein